MDTLIISGPIGAGKTSAGSILVDALSRRSRATKLVELDVIGHEVLADDSTVIGALVDAFGTKILSKEGRIDRQALAMVAFSSPENTEVLNRCTHGRIGERLRAVKDGFSRSNPDGILIVECPLPVKVLFGYEAFKKILVTSKVIVVQSRRELRMHRKTSLASEDFMRRDRLQQLKGEYTGDYLVVNDGTRDDLVSSLENIMESELR